MHAPVESPCIKVCSIEPRTGFCRGCGRTLPEIANWIGMGPTNREAVSGQLPVRLQKMTATQP